MCMSPPLNEVKRYVRRFEHSDAIEIRNGIYLNLRFLHETATYVHMFEAFHTFRSCLLLFRTKPSALQKKPYGSLKKSGANIHLETFTNDGVIFKT